MEPSVHRHAPVAGRRLLLGAGAALVAKVTLVALAAPGWLGSLAWSAEPVAAQPIAIVPPGTPVDLPDALRWNRLILLASPRIASGDVDTLPAAVRTQLPKFTLVLMATVRAVASPEGLRYELAELGAGYALPLDGRLTVVDTENPPPRLELDFIGRQMLSQNGRTLVGLQTVGGAGTMQIFDADTILFRDGRHGDYSMRHFVWVEPVSGECSACVWLLTKRPDGSLVAVDEQPRWLSPGTREDRAIHVDASEYVLGIPTMRAFALLDMPPGQPFPWSPALREVAARRTYPPETVRSLAVELNHGLETLRAAGQAGK